MTIENICFEVEWDQTTAHLAPPNPSIVTRVSTIALEVFSILFPPLGLFRYLSYQLDQFANRVSLPAAHHISDQEKKQIHQQFHQFWYGPITEENKVLRENYIVVRQTVRTPDGVNLDAVCLQYKSYTPETPTVVYFNGNFQLSIETPTWILEESLNSGNACNLVLFDYRGVGLSTGEFTGTRDLVVDGSSIIAWVKKGIGTIPSQIHFYGISLGGAISSLTKSLDPEHLTGRIINDRSFASSSKVISTWYGSGYMGNLISWIFHQYGYSATPSLALNAASGEKLVIYHPYDAVIPDGASMRHAVGKDQIFCLQPKEGFEEMSKDLHHVAPLDWHEEAVEKVIAFLFPPEQAASIVS